MSPAAEKLSRRYGIDLELAEALVKAGFASPGAIRRATIADLVTVPGVGKATANKLKDLV